jgi:hypothetical protein
MSQAINLRALRWAYEQEGLSVTSKAVLLTFAIHANDRGYSWPGVDHIASTWRMDRKTVRRQIEQLIASRKIFRTKKRCGYTGQVKVYRLPKITYESGGKSTRLHNEESVDKESLKSPISGGEFPPNKEQGTQNTLEVRSTSWEEQPTDTHRARSADFDLSLNGLTEDAREVIDHYHETLVPLDWLPVNKITPKLGDVFERCAADELHKLIDSAADASPNEWPRKRKLVNLYWHAKPKKRAPSRSMPIAKRNKIINRLNERKARIMRTFPDGKFAPWAEKELASIQQQLETL